MNGCKDMESLIERLAAGVLEDDEADRAAAHLDECAACRAHLEAIDAPADADLVEAEATAGAPPVSAAEWGRVSRAIEAAVAPAAAVTPRTPDRRFYALAAAFLVMLGAGVAMRALTPDATAPRAAGVTVATSSAAAPEGTVARAGAAPRDAAASSALAAASRAPAPPAPAAAPALVTTAAPTTSSTAVAAAPSAPARPLDPALRAAARGLVGKIRLASTETLHTDEDDEEDGEE